MVTGAGESGKSTILKQMRLIHKGGFRESERKAFRNVIFQNIVEAFLMMFDIMDAQKTAFQDPSNQVRLIQLFHLWTSTKGRTALCCVSRERTRIGTGGDPSPRISHLL